MLPNLDRLALVPTSGFHELTDAERQQLDNDDVNDPVTMERPVHAMTFRVRLPDDDSNGEPRYKYFSPESLWTWVKNHNTLPAREGPIWYEDWWALCNTYNPDHHSIPSWAHRLKHRSQYVAERARERAAQEQQAARERARAEREAEEREAEERDPAVAAAAAAAAALNVRPGNPHVPPRSTQRASMEDSTRIRVRQEDPLQGLPRLRLLEDRYGPQRNSDHLVAWRCWIKGSVLNSDPFADAIRDHFAEHITTRLGMHFGVVGHWNQRLVVKLFQYERIVGRRNLADSGGQDSPATKIEFELYLPSRHVQRFLTWYIGEVAGQGYTTIIERVFGIQNAHQETPGGNNVDRTLTNRGAYQRQNGNPNLPWEFPSLTMEQYQQWGPGGHVDIALELALGFHSLGAPPAPAPAPAPARPRQANWMMEEAMAEMRASDPMLNFRPIGWAATDVTIRWRFWLKGPMSDVERSDNEMHWRRAFADLMDNGVGRLQIPLRTSQDPWFDRLWVWTRAEEPHISGPRTGLQLVPGVIQRCEFALKLPYLLGALWLPSMNQAFADAPSWNALASDWFYVEPIRSTESRDKPRLTARGDTLHPLSVSPYMTEEEYNAWETWQSVPRFRSLGVGE